MYIKIPRNSTEFLQNRHFFPPCDDIPYDLPIPGLFGTPPERLHSSGHTMGGESKQKVAWQLWKGVIHGKIWFLKWGIPRTIR